jgi:DnaJ-class molecular chaperone
MPSLLQQLPQPNTTNKCDYIPDHAVKQEVKLAYQRLASTYHPDKWEHSLHTTRMKLETTIHFQLLSNAQSFLSL